MQGLFDFQNLNNRKATHSFVPRRLIFKLQWEVLKLYDTCLFFSFASSNSSLFHF